MRYMSFSSTIPQVLNRTKTVTRRSGWAKLKAGDILLACTKVMGLKKGEGVTAIATIRIVNVRREPLGCVTEADIALEGLSGMTREDFIAKFAKVSRCSEDAEVTRIEFEYIDDNETRE